MEKNPLREQYEKAQQLGKPAFIERPLIGSPAAPAQAETNSSQLWGTLNAGFLIAYEYTRWWKESAALRNAAVVGDWSWLNKTRVRGKDAARFMNYATVKDLSRQAAGQIVYTPMCDERGKVAIEGLTLKFADDDYLFTQSGALKWFQLLQEKTGLEVALEDVTPDYTVYAIQGPRSTEVLEALTGESWADLKFSRYRKTGTGMIVARQGVTGEVGYELMLRTDTGKAHELWRRIREVGKPFGLRELGLKAQMIGHTETGIATVIRDFIPARGSPEQLKRMLRHWMPPDELESAPWSVDEHLCSPAELGWAYTISLGKSDFLGKKALEAEASAGGPKRRLIGLVWNADDIAKLTPPPDLPTGHFQPLYLRVTPGGWASGYAWSPTLRQMVSLARLDRTVAAGTEVQVEWPDRGPPIRARVQELPFIARNREKVLK